MPPGVAGWSGCARVLRYMAASSVVKRLLGIVPYDLGLKRRLR